MRRLAEFTTFRLGGPIGDYYALTGREEVLAFFRDAPPETLVLGGGSNLVPADDGYPGAVAHLRTTGIQIDDAGGGHALVTAEAGEPWDAFVQATLEAGLSGLEALSGIPGSVGATPIQNVGAYGAEVAQTIERVEVLDRATGQLQRLSAAECGFGYRDSRFKRAAHGTGSTPQIVLAVTFRLPASPLSAPVAYAELARALGVQPGERAEAAQVREAVLSLRRGKGMVLDAADHDSWSAGSFFTNPVVEAAQVPEDAVAFGQPDGRMKVSAAWLIAHAGFEKGYRLPGSRAALSSKHTLALTNRGDATTEEVLELARAVRAGVRERFGITLVPEPQLIRCAL